jgi:exosortase/archaeosortase family protein
VHLAKTKKAVKLNIPKAVVPLLERTAAFLGIFILFSGLIGPRIISSGILYKDGFGIYGPAGKTLLFMVIAFLILLWKKNDWVRLKKWDKRNILWLVLSTIFYFLLWLSVEYLIKHPYRSDYRVALAHVLLIFSLLLAAVGCFGLSSVKIMFQKYRNEILISLGVGIAFYGLLIAIYGLWAVLASIVLHSVSWLLRSISGLSAAVVPPRTLLLSKFGINVAETCSGIESLALFLGLYILVGFVDWERFNHKKFVTILPFALLALFGFNILRVYSLILAGYYINPQIAFSLFHTYAGMVFFIIYSGIFWGTCYKWMLRQPLAGSRDV